MAAIVRQFAHSILPAQQKPRRLLFGLAKGEVANIDFRYDAAYFFGRHEPDLFKHYRRLLRPGLKAFDIGTYRGWDALNIAHFTSAPVVSFDCNPEMLAKAREFLAPAGKPITLAQCFFGDGTGGTESLDAMSDRYGFPDFIKMDIEGAEAAALLGATETLRRKPSMIIETHGAAVENNCIQILRSAGYTPIVVQRSQFFSEARSLEHNRWIVCD